MKVLIIGPSWIGDMVMAQSLFRCLHALDSQTVIDVLALDWTRELLARMPEVNQAITMPIGHGKLALGKRRLLGKALQAEGYQQAIVLPNSFKSALIPFFAKIPKRTGWRGEARGWLLNDCRKLDKQRYPLMVERFAALGVPANFSLSEPALPEPLLRPALKVSTDTQAVLDKFELQNNRPITIFCPGAEFGSSKKWPEAHFAQVADSLINAGKQVWLMGSKNDAQTTKNIIDTIQPEHKKYCVSLAGLTSIGEAIDLMSLAQTVVSNDSGLMHIAAALDKSLVVVYGSTSAEFTPPLSGRVEILNLKLPCSPCFKRECPLGHHDCLNTLSPMLVLDAIRKINSEINSEIGEA
ncbi:MAG: lipopolysaccharide heptosyltransferase II [SAR86 cluster bacterium]|uniref:lipopolysaccharide heptosyltransferase II n=1 Tax=SAR86 cluster bacterium TaxID=2030880 RepID=A0A2A5CHR8_9GAMM|nr:lipopolysaccharide heptosyltransferase II [Gammaproteobacteria bacterium AH-315-E17]PCJ43434.1 MAG: lipopolysaccharide heptosyltransferase II [SAR86 cluster bacterium]